jgi:hypothetical protein
MSLLVRTLLCGLIFLAAASLGHAALAQTKSLPDAKAVRALTDSIMSKVAAGDLEGGLRTMQPYIVVPSAEFETTIAQAKTQAPVMAQRFGKSVGWEFLKEDRAGERLLRVQHLQLFERHATLWTFYFYRAPQGWVLNTFLFKDDIKTFF